MPRFSKYFGLGRTQHELDFVDISNDYDTPVYVDPYAIQSHTDNWAEESSEYIRSFFIELLSALSSEDQTRAIDLMSNFHEPKETFLGVSKGKPKGRGVGKGQAQQLISAIKKSTAFRTGLLEDLSEMALYVEGVDRDKISDLTTNIIRSRLVQYTQQQCALLNIETHDYANSPAWNIKSKEWQSQYVKLPFIENDPVILVPKHIVRRGLSIDSQEFYNHQITDYLVAENLRANSSLVRMVKKQHKVFKGEVRKQVPHSKQMIAEFVQAHPDVLKLYKELARKHRIVQNFNDDDPSLLTVCVNLSTAFEKVASGNSDADKYHALAMGTLTALFHPNLIQPRKEWEINDGRKRVDIVFTNAADSGFFAQQRDKTNIQATMIVVECKNYSKDIANNEIDQLLGRFDNNRGKFGLLTCRTIDDEAALLSRCKDAAVRERGYILVLTDADLIEMLSYKSQLQEEKIEALLYSKLRKLFS